MNIAKGIGLIFGRANILKERLFSPKNLLYTNVGISISLSGTGDVIEQQYEILKVQQKYEDYGILVIFIIPL